MQKADVVMDKSWNQRQNGIQMDAAKVGITVAMVESISVTWTKTRSIAQSLTSAHKARIKPTMEWPARVNFQVNVVLESKRMQMANVVMDKSWDQSQNGIQMDAAKAGITV